MEPFLYHNYLSVWDSILVIGRAMVLCILQCQGILGLAVLAAGVGWGLQQLWDGGCLNSCSLSYPMLSLFFLSLGDGSP